MNKYEKARILGSRALQISMGAPLLVKMTPEELADINYNPIEIAKRELEAGVMPITIRRQETKRKEKPAKVEEVAEAS